MLQPLGISAEAEAVYVALAPLASASVDDLAKLDRNDPGRGPRHPRGAAQARPGHRVLARSLARPAAARRGQSLKAQRVSEVELGQRRRPKSLESHLLAAGATQEDDVKILVGRESIVAAHRELLSSARRGDLRVRQAART